MGLKQIFEGWRNRILPPEELKDQIASISAERMSLCNKCPFHSKFHYTPLRMDDHCTSCGCTLSAKTACLSCACPINKWGAELTPEEEKIIDENETSI